MRAQADPLVGGVSGGHGPPSIKPGSTGSGDGERRRSRRELAGQDEDAGEHVDLGAAAGGRDLEGALDADQG